MYLIESREAEEQKTTSPSVAEEPNRSSNRAPLSHRDGVVGPRTAMAKMVYAARFGMATDR